MTTYGFHSVLVWPIGVGGAVKLARNQRINVTDPATGLVPAGLKQDGQPVSWLTSDASGEVDYTAEVGVVVLSSAATGFSETVVSPDLSVEASGAAAAAASSAAAAAASAALVGAPSKAAMDAAMGGDVAGLVPLVAGKVDRLGTRGATRTIYVRATGNDTTGNGKTTGTAYREIQTAVASLAADGPVIRGSVVIDVGAGTYKGGITLPTTRGKSQDDFIKIKGPATGGSPNVPTAIVDFAADTSASWGILGEDSATFWVEDVKFIGAFPTAVRADRACYLQWRNVHVDGAAIGLFVTNGVRYATTGGRIENCSQGISELFSIVRDYSGATSTATGLTIANCTIGVKSKENCVGHFDYLQVEGCATGIELQLYSGGNMKGVGLKRNTLGIVLTNSEIHNETSIVWGTGADVNTRRILSIGNSSELALTGWVSAVEDAPTMRTGHRPLVLLASSYTDTTITGVTTETTVAQFNTLLRADWYSIQGKRARFVVCGTTASSAPLAAPYRVLLRVGGGLSLAAELSLPAALPATSHFKIEFDMICPADGANQKFIGTLSASGVSAGATVVARTFDLSASDGHVKVSAIPGNAADSVIFKVVEVWG